jgi:hypothetical protein
MLVLTACAFKRDQNATAHGVPRSTARRWLAGTPLVVVSLEVTDLTEPELRQEILRRACAWRIARFVSVSDEVAILIRLCGA